MSTPQGNASGAMLHQQYMQSLFAAAADGLLHSPDSLLQPQRAAEPAGRGGRRRRCCRSAKCRRSSGRQAATATAGPSCACQHTAYNTGPKRNEAFLLIYSQH